MRQNKEQEQELNAQLKQLMQDLKCFNSNPIQRICNNSNCQQFALFCSSSQCQQCHSAHQNCGSYLFQRFTKQVQKKTAGALSQFYQKIAQIEATFIDKIIKSKRRFLYPFSIDELNFSLERKYYHMIDSIYRGKNAQAITGKQAHQLFQKLLETQFQEGCRELQLLQTFQKQSDKLLKQYISTKDWIFDAEHGQKRFKNKINEKQKKNVQKISMDSAVLQSRRKALKLEELLDFQNQKIQLFSNIIYQELEKLDNQFIFGELNTPLSLQLVFRASKHNFSAHQFHHICDGIEGTFTLASNQYEKVIGAYTPLNWFGQGYKPDQSNQTILLGLNQRVRLSLTNPKKAIFCDRNMGPTFGGQTYMFSMMHSFDFSISDDCKNNRKSSMNFPISYRFKGRPVQTQQICGLKNGGNFKVTEYEVYKIVCSQKKP